METEKEKKETIRKNLKRKVSFEAKEATITNVRKISTCNISIYSFLIFADPPVVKTKRVDNDTHTEPKADVPATNKVGTPVIPRKV